MAGTVALVVYSVTTKQPVFWQGIKTASWVVWTGGILGAFYVTVIILAFSKIGPGLTFGLVVAGQLVISLVLEHYNILVSEPHPISIGKIIGVLLVLTGVIVIKQF